MVRKGWRTVEVPNGWLQIIRGPKPPSARWSQTKPSDKPHRAPGVSPDSKQTLTPQVRGPQFPRRTPESNRSAAAAKIARIQASMAALGDEDPKEVELLKKALVKAEFASENSTSGDPDCSCRTVHREGKETSGRGGREGPQGCRGVAPGRGGEGCRHPSNCGGRGTSGASESPNPFNQSHPPQS